MSPKSTSVVPKDKVDLDILPEGSPPFTHKCSKFCMWCKTQVLTSSPHAILGQSMGNEPPKPIDKK